ncbi:DUF599 domain-containing protein [Azohydromonas caseinilytica]|uniref:DUF599 domain-containing protein n=1 Tax=Azohydromonas caseinilytica TaxID=2728836 RepID=A0A848F4Y8_9BURK|nr:DUF599 domain-containing protein [Azohydromonas caseinilytica]NML14158.1 DUF599 domain-containing protein [Azohydromonas caseinilytica]
MKNVLDVLAQLPWLDWLALVAFVAGWSGYASFARRQGLAERSLLATSNRVRRQWMVQATFRDNRVLDGVVVQNMSSAPSFFASTTILIIGGLLAMLSTTERVAELVKEIPFAARTSVLVFDMKLVLLTGIFVYAFFRFTWSLRQYSFGALLVGAAPDRDVFAAMGEKAPAERQAFADRAGRVMGLAAEAFNDGLRGYYMAFAVVGWFFSPLVFMLATAGVLWVLYQREFHSDVLDALRG